MCGCVCECEWERERKGERDTEGRVGGREQGMVRNSCCVSIPTATPPIPHTAEKLARLPGAAGSVSERERLPRPVCLAAGGEFSEGKRS